VDIYDFATGALFWTLVIIFGLIGVVIMVFFLLNLRNLLKRVSPQNRAMQPNLVWLNFIPIFSWVWMIITVIKVRDSVRAEFQARGWVAAGDFGFGVGLAFAILSIFAGGLLVIPLLVCWVIYWVKTAELKNQLKVSQPPVGWSAPAAPPPTPYATPLAPSQGETQAGAETLGVGAGTAAGSIAGTVTGQPDESNGEPQVVCPVCGADNRPNAKFCRSCGRSF